MILGVTSSLGASLIVFILMLYRTVVNLIKTIGLGNEKPFVEHEAVDEDGESISK